MTVEITLALPPRILAPNVTVASRGGRMAKAAAMQVPWPYSPVDQSAEARKKYDKEWSKIDPPKILKGSIRP